MGLKLSTKYLIQLGSDMDNVSPFDLETTFAVMCYNILLTFKKYLDGTHSFT